MGKLKNLTKVEKFAITVLDGLSIPGTKIAVTLGRERSTITKYLKKRNDIKTSKAERNRIIDARMIRRIKRLANSICKKKKCNA